MPTLRQDIKKGKFSNYGSSKFSTPTKNTQYFANKRAKQPTMRGSFPKAVRWSLDDEGITNRRSDYNRGMALNRSAANASKNFEIGVAQTISTANFVNSIYDGNAARKMRSVADVAKKVGNTEKMHAIKGGAVAKSKSTVSSPMLVTIAKFAAIFICLLAILAFIRVGLTSTTVSNGLSSQEISKQIDNELISKNALEVQDSTLANSSRIRQVASQYSLVTPGVIQVINLPQDVLALDDNNNVSLVESLKRVSGTSS